MFADMRLRGESAAAPAVGAPAAWDDPVVSVSLAPAVAVAVAVAVDAAPAPPAVPVAALDDAARTTTIHTSTR